MSVPPTFSPEEHQFLRPRIRQVAARALAGGALQPIVTNLHHVHQAGVRFVVRMLAPSLAARSGQPQDHPTIARPTQPANPFLFPDPALLVADLSPTHRCLLNKYPVVDEHLLVVTRAFEPQESLLTLADFAALVQCTRQIEGLAFYNAGPVAGASQRHKHLQLAPFPLDPAGVDAPIAPLLGAPGDPGRSVQSPHLPFHHALRWLPPDQATDAAYLLDAYRSLLLAADVWSGDAGDPRPYNWLATRQWMLVVPRRAETVEQMPVNALGFAGSLLVRNAAQLAWLRDYGPLNALCAVGVARPDMAP
jgi:ATP adenylyltransferase